MQKKIIIAIVALIVVVGGGYAIFHKSPAKTSPTTTSSAASTTPAATSASIVQTKTNSSGSQYLADSSGYALYTYGADSAGVSNCTDSCLYSWPIYTADASATLPANVTVITRSDGSKQYAYKGLPLYTFSGDSVGQVTGDNVSGFHVAKP